MKQIWKLRCQKMAIFSIITDFIFGAIFRKFQQFFRQQKEISKHNFEPCRSKYAKCQIERGDPVSQLFESETYEFDMYVNCIM